MYCGKCGTQLEPQDRFCPTCGAPAPGAAAPAPNGAYQGSMDEDSTWVLPENEGGEGASDAFDGPAGWDAGQGAAWVEDDDWDAPAPAGGQPAPQRRQDAPRGHAAEPRAVKKPGRTVDATERHELVLLTREEAAAGCRKQIEIEGRILTIDVPANLGPKDSLYFEGYGYKDPATGHRGPLKVQFLID